MSENLRDQRTRSGFATAPDVVDHEFLASVHAAIAGVRTGGANTDILFGATGAVRKITYPLATDRRFLVALAHPGLIRLAVAISQEPEQLVLTWGDILYKAPHTGEAVPVHQDLAMQPSRAGLPECSAAHGRWPPERILGSSTARAALPRVRCAFRGRARDAVAPARSGREHRGLAERTAGASRPARHRRCRLRRDEPLVPLRVRTPT